MAVCFRSTQDQVNEVTKSIRQANVSFKQGSIKKTYPVNQIEEMKYQELDGGEAIKGVFKAALKEDTANLVLFADEGNYQKLKRRFLDKYWSVTIQREISSYLRSGRYEGDNERENYFLK